MHSEELTICIADRLLANGRMDGFAGHDPFDSLNSEFLKATPLYRSEMARLLWLQFGKRSPLNLRPLLRVPKKRNPKGVGLFISGLIEDYGRTENEALLAEATDLATWLLSQRSDLGTWEHSCWGYHFDWQARAFYVPHGKPNIITTCYVARALDSLGELTGDGALVDVALDSARFISKHLYTEADGRCFYAYIPGEQAFVHNASLWGAAWCGYAGRKLGDEGMVQQALRVARQSVREQKADGSWVYGGRHHHQFVDGFHTGYNLEALHILGATLGTNEFSDCIARGYAYYTNTLIKPDGTAKYYSDSVYPIDMHNFAQAIFTLLKVGRTSADVALCDAVVHRAIELMYQPKTGQFCYQKTRWFTNRIDYTRWTQAWAYYALAFYNNHRD